MCIYNTFNYFFNSFSVFRYYSKIIKELIIIYLLYIFSICISNFKMGKTLKGVAVANFLDPSIAKFRR